MKILLSEASSLTSLQVATILSRQGHKVDVLSPRGITLTKLSRHISCIHSTPIFRSNPSAWLEAATQVITRATHNGEAFDLMICTSEQVAVISANNEKIRELGIQLAVPESSSLKKVMNKIAARTTLAELGLKQPKSIILNSSEDLDLLRREIDDTLPAYIKQPMTPGTTGFRRITSTTELLSICKEWETIMRHGGLLLQSDVNGPLIIICGIFSRGNLTAWHAYLQARKGINGSASKKISCPLPITETSLRRLGEGLKWHGALSAKAILIDEEGEKELLFKDIIPTIVEPMNGLLVGVDLVDALMDVSIGHSVEGKVQIGREGVQSHQLALSLLAAAKEGRVSLIMEVWMAFGGLKGYYGYKGSVEESTPLEGDWLSVLVLAGLTLLLLLGGNWMAERLSGSFVESHAICAQNWLNICQRENEKSKVAQIWRLK